MSARRDDMHATLNAPARPAAVPAPGAPDIEIARSVTPRRILLLAEERLGLSAEALVPIGHYKAKLSLETVDGLKSRPQGKLILVTAVTPTAAGEGKTTTSIGLNDGLNRLGVRSSVCLREPSLGPCFGMKGGAAGGGWSQVIPMEDINLHFNGDMHAVTAAHNLLAAVIDNHLHWGNELDIDPRQITWRRVVDLNDRALRHIKVGLGGKAHGVPREDGYDITVASEIMAVLCLSTDLEDLHRRLGEMVVARRRDLTPVTARDLRMQGALSVLLKDAMQPNLVQSLEHNPVFIHGGPFGNIAHGCNSVMATHSALALNDFVVTEAGFGADLGAEKFLNIKCRQSGLRPDAVVLVCTVRALKLQGGVSREAMGTPDSRAVRRGAANLARHLANLRRFGLSPLVAINRFPTDTREEIAAVQAISAEHGASAIVASHCAEGGQGAVGLAGALLETVEQAGPEVALLYPDDMGLAEKIETVAKEIYGAAEVSYTLPAARQLEEFEKLGYAHLPVCIAKTQYSFSADPALKGAPEGHVLPVREARLCAGAGFIVAICGDIMTMPGLPRHPAALDMGLDARGRIFGLS